MSMTQPKERQILLGVCAGSLVLCIVLFLLTLNLTVGGALWDALFVLFLGLACECGMRLVLTAKINYDHDRLFVTTSGWFQKTQLDKRLFEKEKVRVAGDLQTYDPDAFRVENWSRELVIQHTCTYELLNEINAVAAFLVLFFVLFADNKLPALILLFVLSLAFSAWAVIMAMRARQFRFNIKAGRY